MFLETLQRRRVQLEVVNAACAESVPATIRLRRNRYGLAGQTRFMDRSARGVTIAWPNPWRSEWVEPNAPIELIFATSGRRYRMETECWGAPTAGVKPDVLELKPPISVLPVDDLRRAPRLQVHPGARIPIEITGVGGATLGKGVIVDLSTGGIAFDLPEGAGRKIDVGEILWGGFELPDDREGFEFPIRATHVEHGRAGATARIGGAFHALEDSPAYARELRRLEAFILQEPERGEPATEGGTHEAGA